MVLFEARKHSELWQHSIMSEFGLSDSVFSVIACQFAMLYLLLSTENSLQVTTACKSQNIMEY